MARLFRFACSGVLTSTGAAVRAAEDWDAVERVVAAMEEAGEVVAGRMADSERVIDTASLRSAEERSVGPSMRTRPNWTREQERREETGKRRGAERERRARGGGQRRRCQAIKHE